jgi:DNA-binding response OmpR family regulator
MNRSAARPRVLIVEDEWHIADDLQHSVRMAGMEVVGPVPDAEGALELLEREEVDVAVLDVRLRDGDSLPVAAKLQEAAIPFVFVSADESIPAPFHKHRRLVKAYDPQQLLDILRRAVEADS